MPDVKEIEKNGVTVGYNIVVANLEKMPMPIILKLKLKVGGGRDQLPVDVWMRNKTWTVYYPSAEEVVAVDLDPKMFCQM